MIAHKQTPGWNLTLPFCLNPQAMKHEAAPVMQPLGALRNRNRSAKATNQEDKTSLGGRA